MKKVVGLFGVVALAAAFAGSASAQLLLSEVEIDPPVEVGDRCQYVEIYGSGTIPANTWFISINSDQSNFGFLSTAVDLSGQSFGINNHLVLTNTLAGTCPNRTFDPGANVLQYANILTLGKGSESYYIVTSPNMLFAGMDIDADDNGAVDNLTGGLSITFVDGFSLVYNPEEHYSYGPGPNLVESFLGDVPDAATRFPGNTDANSAAAWYSGELADSPEETTAYGTDTSSNFPVGGMLTPGGMNVPAAQPNVAPYDFDGDGRTDISTFRPTPGAFGPEGSSSQWWILRSSDLGNNGFTFGFPTDIIVPADYTGDGKADLAFFRPSEGSWYVLRSEDNSFFAFPFGQDGDRPTSGDFDGDGTADFAVYRPSTGQWSILRSSDGGVTIVPFGIAEDIPTVADYDGDGISDISVYRPSLQQWWQLRSTEGVIAFTFGFAGDTKTVQGDYTGDGKADVAFYRPSTSEWFVLRSEDLSFFGFTWGAPGDVANPGDYDGDGIFDAAVSRESAGFTWYILGSQSGFFAAPFGAAGDIPVPSTGTAP